MAKRGTKMLRLEGKLCRFGKISNNTERHGDDWDSGFTIPVTELLLTKVELNALMRDAHTWASWFDSDNGKGKAAEPMPWWGDEPFYLSESFEADKLLVTVNVDRELEFEAEGDPKEDTYRPACMISKLKLRPQVGGMTELCFSLYVRPGLGPTNLALQKNQHSEVKLTVIDAKVAEREKRQPQLPMGEGGDSPPPAEAGTEAAAATH